MLRRIKFLLKISYTEYKVLVLENYRINLHSEPKDLEEVFKETLQLILRKIHEMRFFPWLSVFLLHR